MWVHGGRRESRLWDRRTDLRRGDGRDSGPAWRGGGCPRQEEAVATPAGGSPAACSGGAMARRLTLSEGMR